MNPVKAALWILLAPQRFERKAVRHAIDLERRNSDEFRTRFDSAKLAPETISNFERTARGQVQALRRVARESFVLCVVTIVAGYALGVGLNVILGEPPKWLVNIIQAIGASAILGASISEDPREIETFDRSTLPEQIHQAFFRGLVALGTFVFVASVAWDTF